MIAVVSKYYGMAASGFEPAFGSLSHASNPLLLAESLSISSKIVAHWMVNSRVPAWLNA
jgi:hypothetical protein